MLRKTYKIKFEKKRFNFDYNLYLGNTWYEIRNDKLYTLISEICKDNDICIKKIVIRDSMDFRKSFVKINANIEDYNFLIKTLGNELYKYIEIIL